MSEVTPSVAEIRSAVRAYRQQRTPAQQQQASAQCCATLIATPLWQQSQHIAFYLAHDGEINPEAALLAAHEAGKTCYLPVLHPQQKKNLLFLRYQPGDTLIPNRYGILEPEFMSTSVFLTWKLDVACVPLVAFDSTGTRLGMGKGYYDRTFAYIKQNPQLTPTLVGLAYDEQQQSRLTRKSWDVPLHTIITETTLHQPGATL